MVEIKFKILEIENFRNYESINFNFEPNRFCVITGPNGSGKTTLAIDAICWCLFDETSKGRKGDSVIRKRSGKNTRVCLTYSIDSDEYRIENNRKHDRYGDAKVIYKNGSSITGATRKETNNIISSILMPKDVFKNCLLFSQYINKPFAEMGDTGQKNIFDLMMGFEKFNRYYDNSKDYIKNIEKELKILNEELLLLNKSSERNKELLDSEIEDTKRVVDDFNNRKMNLELEISDLVDINKCLMRDISKKDEILKEYENIKENISNTRLELNTLNTKFDNEKKLVETKILSEKRDKKDKIEKDYSERLLSIGTELNSVNNAYNVLKEEINTKNESLKSEYYQKKEDIETPIRNKLDTLTEEYRSAQKELQVLKTSMESIQNDIDSLIKEIKDMDNKLSQDVPVCFACKQEIKGDNLEEIKIICDEKKSKLDKNNKSINHIKSKILELREIISTKEKSIDGTNKKKEEELQKLDGWKVSVLEDLSNYKDLKLKDLKTKEIELENKKDSITNEIEQYSRSIEREYEIILSDKVRELEDNIKGIIIKLEDSLKDLNSDRILKEELIEKINNIHTRISLNDGSIKAKKEELNTIIPLHKKYLKDNDIKIEKLKGVVYQDIERNISTNNNIKKYERKLLISKFWKIAFSPKGIRAILLDDSIPTLNEKAKELSIATDCIRVTFDSQKLLESGESRNQFCVNPIQTKNLTDKREDFSQGEGRMVDIITLLSLRHLLEVTYERKFNISLFDEILDSLYKDNAEIVIDFLKKMSEDSCTILITHTLKNYIDPDEHLELGR